MKDIHDFFRNHLSVFTGLVALLVGLFLYRDFIVDAVPYLATTSDGIQQFYPHMVNVSQLLRNGEFPMWSFNIALGAPHLLTWLGDPFKLLLVLLGEQAILYGAVFMQILKLALAAIFIHLYLQRLSMHKIACFIGGITYAYCGISIVRGNWLSYSTEVTLFALILYASERFYRDGKWILLTVSIAVVLSSFSIYYLFFYGLLLVTYSILRYCIDHGFSLKELWPYLMRCGGIYLTGATLAAVFVLPQIFISLDSARFSTIQKSTSVLTQLFSLFNPGTGKLYLSEIFRTFSNDIVGEFVYYSGFSDMLGGPLSYCGLIHLLIFPQALILAGKRLRIVFLTALAAIVIYNLFPGIVKILSLNITSGAYDIYYKLNSLWICTIIIGMSCYGISKIISGFKINIKALVITLHVLFVVLAISTYLAPFNNITVGVDILLSILIFLLLYFWAFMFYNKCHQSDKKLTILLVIVCLEATIFSGITVNASKAIADVFTDKLFDRPLESQQTEISQKSFGYGLEKIKLEEIAPFYRIRKDYSWSMHSDPMYWNYYGAVGYYGYIPSSELEFFSLASSRITVPSAPTKDNRTFLDTLLGVKYFVTKGGTRIPEGYELYYESDGVMFYINTCSLPLGFVYEDAISRENFSKLSESGKDLALLNYYVTENAINQDISDIHTIEYSPIHFDFDSAQFVNMDMLEPPESESVHYLSTNIDPQIIFEVPGTPERASYKISFETESDRGDYGEIFWCSDYEVFSESNSLRFNVPEGINQQCVYIDDVDVKTIRIDVGNLEDGKYSLRNLKIEAFDYKEYIREAFRSASKRREEYLGVTYFSNNHVEGSISITGEKMLFLSIPYAKGWTAKVNGEKRDIEKINIGFIGIPLTTGNYTIELDYQTPGLILGAWISLASLCALIIWFTINKFKLKGT